MGIQTFWLFVTILSLIVFGSLSSIVYFIVNSPRRKSEAEIEKLKKLKELDLMELYQGNRLIEDRISEFNQRLDEHENQIARLDEENDFLKRLLERKPPGTA
jgi:hypothetical protein